VTPMLRVAVFDDSLAMRTAIRAAVEREPDMRVVAEQASAADAAAVVARSHARDAAVVFAAREAGALHMAEPAPGAPHYEVRCAAFAELLRTVAGAQPARMQPPEPRPSPPGQPLPARGARGHARGAPEARAWPDTVAPLGRIGAVGIVASAGGPRALGVLLHALPAGVMPPILLVQHLAAGFAASFAGWLGATEAMLAPEDIARWLANRSGVA
jgi:chemotaxis response regulator CheB